MKITAGRATNRPQALDSPLSSIETIGYDNVHLSSIVADRVGSNYALRLLKRAAHTPHEARVASAAIAAMIVLLYGSVLPLVESTPGSRPLFNAAIELGFVTQDSLVHARLATSGFSIGSENYFPKNRRPSQCLS